MGIGVDKLAVVYNGIDVAEGNIEERRQKKNALGKKLGLGYGVPVLVNIGRLVEAKANHIFIEACGILDSRGIDFVALIVGDGPEKNQIANINHRYT